MGFNISWRRAKIASKATFCLSIPSTYWVNIASENSESLFTEMWTNCGSKFGDKLVSITYWEGSLRCDKLNGLSRRGRSTDWHFLPLRARIICSYHSIFSNMLDIPDLFSIRFYWYLSTFLELSRSPH